MKRQFKILLVSASLIVLSIACQFAPGPRDTIIGKWKGDTEGAKADPGITAESENNPMGDFFLEALEQTYETLSVEMTGDEFSASIHVPGEAPVSRSFAYTILASGRKSVTIRSPGKGMSELKLVIKITDRDHIRIEPSDLLDEQFPLILERKR
jgi:hypothetical protein